MLHVVAQLALGVLVMAQAEDSCEVTGTCSAADDVVLLQLESKKEKAEDAMSRGTHANMMSHVLGSFSQLEFEVQPCSIVGTWHSAWGNRSMAFDVNDSKLMLQIGDAPQLTVHWPTEGDKQMQFFIGGEAQQLDRMAESRLIEVVRASTKDDLKSVSDLLGIHGASGNKAPSGCFYKLHYALLGITKLNGQLGSTIIPTIIPFYKGIPYANPSGASRRRRRGDDSSKCGVSPPHLSGTPLDDRVNAAQQVKPGATGGWYADNYGNPYRCADWTGVLKGNVQCTQPYRHYKGNYTGYCQGLCGPGCDCWLGICGQDYHCQYNQDCCRHDYECTDFRSWKCLAVKHLAVGTLCQRNYHSPAKLKGPLKKGQGCNSHNWCQSGKCTWYWWPAGWYCD